MTNNNLTRKELDQWWKYRQQIVHGWHMEGYEETELFQLNHRVLEAAQGIHNDNMLRKDK